MKEEISLIRIGKTSLYLRIPAWFRNMRDLTDGDTVVFMPENVDDDGAVRLKFVKAKETAEAAE
jgi:hypothetical protein